MLFRIQSTAQEKKNALAMQLHLLPPSQAPCSGCRVERNVFYLEREFWIFCEPCGDLQSVSFSLRILVRLVN
jgi:hypothetical protein